MTVREYIGARYVPLFSDPIEWNRSLSYEPLVVVTYQGASYVSKQSVPPDVEITNETYWLKWADYNAQLQAYLNRVDAFDGRIEANSDAIAAFNEELGQFEETTNANILTETENRKAADAQLKSDYEAAGAQLKSDYEAADAQLKSDYEAADAQLKSDYEYLQNQINNSAYYIYPTIEGKIRINKNEYTEATAPAYFQPQGLAIHNNVMYTALVGTGETAGIYRHQIGSNQSTFLAEVNTYHSSDIVYIPDIQEFWITSTDQNINRYDFNFNFKATLNIGLSNPLIAYDKITKEVYAKAYSENTLYKINIETLNTEAISNIDDSYDKWVQSIAANNGILYILYSFPAKVNMYDIVTGTYRGTYYIGDNYYAPVGETEGIDFDDNGNMYITGYANYRTNSIYNTTLFKTDFNNPHSGLSYTRTIRETYTTSHTDTALQQNQTPDGTLKNPFPTIDEAMLFMSMHKNLNRLILRGNHSMEFLETLQPYLQIEGQAEGEIAKPSLSRALINCSAYFYNVSFEPQITVPNLILGYRNGPITVHNVSKAGAHTTTTSGYDYQGNYPINTVTTNNSNF